jgi:dienelactone hydrolase
VSRPRAVLACLGLALAPAPLAARQSSDYTAPPGAPYTAEPVTVPTPMGHTLAGTLTLPAGASRSRPAAVIVTISGTGPQDRDEHLGFGGYRPFRQIADSLGRRGIAVLRMDDRGTGASKGTFKGTTHFEFAEDIRAALQYLRTRPEIDTSRIGLVGHSEGALDAAIVASKEPVVRAIVLLAGQARPLRQSLENQLRDLIRHNPRLTPAQQDSAIARTPATVDSILAADRYMRTIVLYDPSATAREVSKSAVLILTGATDRRSHPGSGMGRGIQELRKPGCYRARAAQSEPPVRARSRRISVELCQAARPDPDGPEGGRHDRGLAGAAATVAWRGNAGLRELLYGVAASDVGTFVGMSASTILTEVLSRVPPRCDPGPGPRAAR